MKMSAKLVYSLTDNENPDLHKQIGCMNGFFQLFDRHRRIASHGRIINDQSQNRVILKPGQNGNQEVEANIGLEKAKEKDSKKAIKEKETKKVVKEKRRSSTESSSRHSFSSSSCSSSFSSLDFNNNNNKTTNTEPSNSTLTTQLSRKSVDLREVVKYSMRREARGLSVKTAAAKEPALRTLKYFDSPRPVKDFRRLSYDGRESRDGLKPNARIRDLPRLSLDGRQGSAARPSFLSDLRIEKRSPNEAASLLQEPGSSRRASSVVAKLMGLADPVPTADELPRLERIDPGPGPLSRPPSRRGSQKIPVEAAPWSRGSPAKASTTPLTVYGEIEKRLADLEFKKSGKDLRALKQILEAMQKSESAVNGSKLASQESDGGVARSPTAITRPAAGSIGRKAPRNAKPVQARKATDGASSSRLSPRRVGSDRQSCPVGPADSNFRRRNGGRRSPESSSPGRKFRPRTGRDRSSESFCGQGIASPLRSESNASLASEDIDGEFTSTVHPDHNSANRKTVEPGRATPEQPSPISVLDAAFYRDESPSPVKKTSSAFKDDDEILYPDEPEWAIVDQDQQSNGLKSSDENVKHWVTNKFFSVESANPDHIYISDILSASDLLRETNIPFNPKLFFAVEQRRARAPIHPKPGERVHRKLVFDVVNEILAQRRDNPRGHQELLGELCFEVDRLQGKSSGEEEDVLRSAVTEDMARWPMNRREYGREVPAVVLDVERLIFKDLVTELITGMKTCPGLLCFNSSSRQRV